MKRFVVVVVCLALLLPVLSVTVFASSSYAFYPFEPVMFYGESSSFFPGGEGTNYFFYDGILPAGKYEVVVLGEGYGQSIEVVCNEGTLDIGNEGFSAPVSVSIYIDGNFYSSFTFGIQVFYEDGVTFFVIESSEEFPIDVSVFSVAHFSLVEEAQSITSVVTPDLLNGILDQVVPLIPVAFGVIVGCVGLRKAIAWLSSVLRGA